MKLKTSWLGKSVETLIFPNLNKKANVGVRPTHPRSYHANSVWDAPSLLTLRRYKVPQKILKRSNQEKIIFLSQTIFLLFSFSSASQASEIYMALILLIFTILFIVITFRVFIIPYFRLNNESLFLSAAILGKTYKIDVNNIKLIQRIEKSGLRFYLKNGTKIDYIPKIPQSDQLIEDIIIILSHVDNLNKHLVLQV
jgi:hypothetical protein